jgi:hypothetical protein
VLVQNLDARPRTIDVAVRAANLSGQGPAGKRVTLAGGQRAEVRFDFTTRARGRAVVQTIATSDGFADASNVELPVYEPATTEAFATYGTVDDAPRFEQLAVPIGIFTDVGGVEVELASCGVQKLHPRLKRLAVPATVRRVQRSQRRSDDALRPGTAGQEGARMQ